MVGASLALLILTLSLLGHRLRRRGSLPGRRGASFQVALVPLFFALWELALRAGVGPVDHPYVPDPYTFWAANPQLNEQARRDPTMPVVGPALPGIFDREHPVVKTPGAWRIVFTGDSQAISLNSQRYAGRKTHPKQLEQARWRGPEGRPLEVINAAMSGFTSWQGLLLLRSELLKLQPDVLVEAFGYHDANRGFSHDREVLTDSRLIHELRTVLYRSRIFQALRSAHLRRQERTIDQQDFAEMVTRVPPDHFKQNLREMVRLGREGRFQVVFLLEPLQEPSIWSLSEPYREVARALSRELEVPLIDLFTPVSRMTPGARAALFTDDIHLTEAGHRWVAGQVARALEAAGLLSAGPEAAQPSAPR